MLLGWDLNPGPPHSRADILTAWPHTWWPEASSNPLISSRYPNNLIDEVIALGIKNNVFGLNPIQVVCQLIVMPCRWSRRDIYIVFLVLQCVGVLVCHHCLSDNSRRTWHINSSLGCGFVLGDPRSLLFFGPPGQISRSFWLKQRNVVEVTFHIYSNLHSLLALVYSVFTCVQQLSNLSGAFV